MMWFVQLASIFAIKYVNNSVDQIKDLGWKAFFEAGFQLITQAKNDSFAELGKKIEAQNKAHYQRGLSYLEEVVRGEIDTSLKKDWLIHAINDFKEFAEIEKGLTKAKVLLWLGVCYDLLYQPNALKFYEQALNEAQQDKKFQYLKTYCQKRYTGQGLSLRSFDPTGLGLRGFKPTGLSLKILGPYEFTSDEKAINSKSKLPLLDRGHYLRLYQEADETLQFIEALSKLLSTRGSAHTIINNELRQIRATSKLFKETYP